MISNLLTTFDTVLYGQRFDYTLSFNFRPAFVEAASGLEDSQDEGLAFGDRYTMFEVRGQ
jgi:hypothetical protein